MESILQFLTLQFQKLLPVSLKAGLVILLVICVRMLLKRAPKIFSYALWGIVLLRLLVPLSIESPVGVLPPKTEFAPVAEVNRVLPEMEFETPADRVDNRWHVQNSLPGEPQVQVTDVLEPTHYLAVIWCAGVAIMALHSLVSYRKLRRRVHIAVALEKGVFLADDIATAFVMGIIRSRIFLPACLKEGERDYIIAHERQHLRRGDHIFKALGFLALTVHWFNPLVWIAFVLAGRDMEMSCDEAVVRKLGTHIRADYSASLLNLATGHRLFSITPLAFGEGNPTGRVRNLAKWKKPALWVSVICLVLCCVLAVCLLTDREAEGGAEVITAETVPAVPADTTPPETEPLQEDWCISIKLDRVSRTGATALFVYSGPTVFSYGDFLSLEQWTGDAWVSMKELDGYENYVGDSSYPVLDGYGMVHEWTDRFGELPDGTYRLGKKVIKDATGEARILYGEFSIPGSIRTGPVPLQELPEKYAAEEAMLDGCFVQRNGTANDNKELFHEFVSRSHFGEPGFIRIVNWDYGEESVCNVYDLAFDGSAYTFTWLENGEPESMTFKYLKHFTGEKEVESAAYDSYEHYVLVNDNALTWTDIWRSIYAPSPEDVNISFMTVYSDYIKHPVAVKLPENLTRAVLEFEGEPMVTVTDADQLAGIYQLFEGADVLGYTPKTDGTGVQLHLILTFDGWLDVTIDLDAGRDVCRIDGEYVFYGAFDEPDYIEKLWNYLGISAWPDAVYEKCPYAYGSQTAFF